MTDNPADYQVLVPLNPGTGSRALLALRHSGTDDRRTPIVLLPIPRDVLDDPESLLRLERETARAAMLDHPCILRVYGLVETSIGRCRAVEYAHGETLRAILNKAGHIPLSVALRLASDVAAGVHYAHLAGNEDGSPLVHGDLRPETIMVSLDGSARVSGYGALSVAPREPSGGRRVVGRRKYAAPEQVLGGRSSMAPATDVFLLGLTLYEMLTGEIPFQQMEDPEGAVLEKAIELDRGDIPAPLRPVIAKATAKRSRERYASALDLRLALEEAMAGELATGDEVQNWIVPLLANDPRHAELSAAIAQALEAPDSVAPHVRAPSMPPRPLDPGQVPPPVPAEALSSAPPMPAAPPSPAAQPTPLTAAPAALPAQLQVTAPLAVAPVPEAATAPSAPLAAPLAVPNTAPASPTQPPTRVASPPGTALTTSALGRPTLTALPPEKTIGQRLAHLWPFLVAGAIVAAFLIGQYLSAPKAAVPAPGALLGERSKAADSAPEVQAPAAGLPSAANSAAPGDRAPPAAPGDLDSDVRAQAADLAGEESGAGQPAAEISPAPRVRHRALASARGTPVRRGERARPQGRQGGDPPSNSQDRAAAATATAARADAPGSAAESSTATATPIAETAADTPPEVRTASVRHGSAAPLSGAGAAAPQEDLEAELEAALISASAMERQPSRTEVLTGRARRGDERAAADGDGEAASKLHLFTIPQVTARIKGGKSLGRTPLLVPMAPGSYTIELIDESQRIRTERVIAVGERGVSKIDVTLGIGAILVTAPDGASIIIDGRRWGVAPISKPIELYEGRHTLRVSSEEDDWERTFELNKDDMLNFNFGSGSYVPRR